MRVRERTRKREREEIRETHLRARESARLLRLLLLLLLLRLLRKLEGARLLRFSLPRGGTQSQSVYTHAHARERSRGLLCDIFVARTLMRCVKSGVRQRERKTLGCGVDACMCV